ncbi:MAG: DUF6989 domain-containing protein, partial [Candidatus Hermodarchaeota archaeon]
SPFIERIRKLERELEALKKTMEENKNTSKITRDFIIVHLIFVGVCVAILTIPIPFGMGIKLFILVICYNLLIFVIGFFRKYNGWLRQWYFVLVISLFQIFPDWFLSAQLGVLIFPEDGLFKIGPVSGYMAGLWVIPLFLICFIGSKVKDHSSHAKGLVVVGLMSLFIFVIAEQTMWMLQSWYPQNVTLLFDHLAVYIVIPEVILGLSTFYCYNKTKSQHILILIVVAFGIMLLYLGNASFFYLIFEKIIFI